MQYANNELVTELNQVGQHVRTWAMRQAAADDSIGIFLCSKTLGGMCARASAKLYRVLSRRGIQCTISVVEMMGGTAHAFVEVGDYIVDVTATQFDEALDKVIVLERTSEKLNRPFWYGGHRVQRFTNYRDFARYVSDWEYTQRRDI
jgi:hypothetical protein